MANRLENEEGRVGQVRQVTMPVVDWAHYQDKLLKEVSKRRKTGPVDVVRSSGIRKQDKLRKYIKPAATFAACAFALVEEG